jgi:hypothetical protein
VARAARRLAAALALAIAAPCAWPEELGTLFHTPEERARLDRLRRGEPESPALASARSGAPQITGFVKRSDGRHTVWIDGRPVEVGSAEAARRLDAKSVRAYSDRGDDDSLKVERKPPR